MNEAEVILEVPAGWFDSPRDGSRHQRLYASLLTALARLSVRILPVELPFGADTADRRHRHDQLVISYHSRGRAGHVLRFKEAYIPPYYTLDRMGFSGFSELALMPESFLPEINAYPVQKARAEVSEIADRLQEENLSKYEQPDKETSVPVDGFVFMPLQTENDPVATLAHLDQLDVARRLAKDLGAAGKTLVVKRHPLCTSSRVGTALTKLAATCDNVVVSTGSIHSLIARSDCVVGANSGVLFEALVQGAHVVSFAASDFQLATTNIQEMDGLNAAVLAGPSVDSDFRMRFLAWYLKQYCVLADDAEELTARIAQVMDQMDVLPHADIEEQKELFYQASAAEALRRKGFRDPS